MRLDCVREWAEIVADDVDHDRMVGVEVAMGEVVSHPCDLLPRDIVDGGEEVGVDALDGFADLEEPDADGVVYETVVKVA